jgi:putative oxidoreductase
MNSSSNCCEKWAPCARAALRIVIGFLFLQHGAQKLFGWPAPMPMAGPLPTTMVVGGWLEFVGGILIVLGLFTRPVAFILCGEMAFAYWTVHFKPTAQLPLVNKGELAVIYCFVFFYFIFAGAGSASLDKLIWGRKCCDSHQDKDEPGLGTTNS